MHSSVIIIAIVAEFVYIFVLIISVELSNKYNYLKFPGNQKIKNTNSNKTIYRIPVMISRIDRINAFIELGKFLNDPKNAPEIEVLAVNAYRKNNWFTPKNTQKSIQAIATQYLDPERLRKWAESYAEPRHSKKIGVVMAGNIPAVGFHDLLSVLISGHTLLAKLSSDDAVLIPALLEKLVQIAPAMQDSIRIVERLNDADAYIATGSDNTARYFEYYLSNKPHVIRKNRMSVAILNGTESDEDLACLGGDVLQYFGLGCRNVAKIFVPSGYDFTKFYESIEALSEDYLHHHKYFNNYEYNKSVLLINRTHHFDNGFLMITENPAFVSPISVLHYETYENAGQVNTLLEAQADKIQCVVGNVPEISRELVAFGDAQKPGLYDYADAVDTMAFLSQI
jgi:hypothetical protein